MLWLLLLGCPFVSAKYAASIRDGDGDGYDGVAFDGPDCNDDDPTIHPGADEVWSDDVDHDCDGNANDQDGDGVPWDEDCDDALATVGATRTWYEDRDGDGFGGASIEGACEPAPGQVAQGEDCDDTRPDVNPSAPERCDPLGVDEDCDGAANDQDTTGPAPLGQLEWYGDVDGDGFGAGTGLLACDPGEGFSLAEGDCDDTDEEANPNAVWYVDRDDDGYGDDATGIANCLPIEGRVPTGGDCNDTDATRNPAVVDAPFDLVDADCAGDTDLDGDGDGLPDPLPTWSQQWPIDELPCPQNLQQHEVGVGHPYATIQEAVDAAGDCDTVVVHDGIYDDFVVTTTGLVVAAAPGSSPVVRGGKGLEATASLAGAGVLISGLHLKDAPIGVFAAGAVVLDRITVSDALFAVESQGDLLITGSRFERATFGVHATGDVLVVSDSTFADVVGVGGVVSAYDNTLDEILLDDVRFERCSGGALPIVHVQATSMSMYDVAFTEPGSSALLASVDGFDGEGLRVEGGVSLGDHLLRIHDRDLLTSGTVSLRDVFVRGHVWVPLVLPAFVAVDDFDDTELQAIVLRGNVATVDDDSDLVPVWLRSTSLFAGRTDARTLRNIEVSAGQELTGAVTGVGILTQAGVVEQATVVGMNAAVWPLEGRQTGDMGSAVPPTLRNAIAWGNDNLYLLSPYLLTPAGPPLVERIVADNACTTCFGSDPRFLRYDPAMPAGTWDLRLRRDSPYYRHESPTDTSSTCGGTFAVELQLGAFGAYGDGQADATPYDDCDDDGMYDTWEWEFAALLPHLDEDGDGLDNLGEFEAGTFPHLTDSDSDSVPDDVDAYPLDPTR